MTNEIATINDAQIMENVLLGGDLSKLTPAQRVSYYQRVCESLNLNPLTKPFGYITLNGKLVLYALKDAAEQLRSSRKVSITQLEKQFNDDLYIVTAYALTPDGRTDASTGVVTIGNLKGDAKANALMKAETKAKRRVTLSICGMGFLDESEISSIPDARPMIVTESGEITPMSYDDAKQVAVTSKGKEKFLGELNVEQLNYIIEHNKDEKVIEAAKVVLEHDFNMTQE